jgi:hypothetical protein
MNVSNDSPATNYVDFFTKQLPIDLANMAALRDELAIRQGALSSAKDAVADREIAAAELAKAKENAASTIAEAKIILDKAKIKQQETDASAKEFSVKSLALSDDLASREKKISIAEAKLTQTAETQKINLEELIKRETSLNSAEQLLQIRVKTFQDKVASLSA